MSIPTEVIMRMATLGLSEEQAKAVADMLTAVEGATKAEADKLIEAGRAKARARMAKWRETHSSDVTERSVTSRSVTQPLAGGDAHVDDKTSYSEIEPQEQVRAKRAFRLPEDWILPVEWRSDALTVGLPENRIDLEAAKLRDWSRSSKNGAKLDWRAAWRNWCREAAARLPRAGPTSSVIKDTPANAARRRLEAYQNGRNGSETDDHQPAVGLIPGHAIRLVG